LFTCIGNKCKISLSLSLSLTHTHTHPHTHTHTHTHTPGTAYADSMMLAGFNVGWASIGANLCVCVCARACLCVCVRARAHVHRTPRNLSHIIIITQNYISHTPLDIPMNVPITLLRNNHLPHIHQNYECTLCDHCLLFGRLCVSVCLCARVCMHIHIQAHVHAYSCTCMGIHSYLQALFSSE